MVLETPVPGALVGKTIIFILGDQFARLKLGDRFFFDLQNQAGSFTIGICILLLSLTAGPTKRQALPVRWTSCKTMFLKKYQCF